MYNFIVNRIKLNEETSGGMVGMATTQGNPTVDYLPGGWATARNMFNSLSPLKKQWKLKVLDEADKDCYNINIEDAFNIRIPKKSYNEFNNKVINTLNKTSINLTEMLNEDVKSEIEANLKRVHRSLVLNIKKIPQVYQSIVLLQTWLRLFPKSQPLQKNKNTLISLTTIDTSIPEVLEYIKTLYANDLGKLEILVNALETRSALSALPPFSSYDYLIGTKVETDYQGVKLVLELSVDSSLHAIQKIGIEDEGAAEALRSVKTIKVVNGYILPINLMFNVKDFTLIKKVIDDAVNA